MSTFYRCDRCKREFIKKPNTIKLKIHDMGLMAKMDLCEDCSSGFRNWAKGPSSLQKIFDDITQDYSKNISSTKEAANEQEQTEE